MKEEILSRVRVGAHLVCSEMVSLNNARKAGVKLREALGWPLYDFAVTVIL